MLMRQASRHARAAVGAARQSSSASSTTTHFGDRTVPTEEKAGLVKGVFSSVANNYDLMNDLMSGGMHRLWKDDFVGRLNLPAIARATGCAPRCLDVAGGTGDIAFRMAESLAAWLPPLEEDGAIPLTVSDPNEEMLSVGRERQQQRGIDASCLQFEVGDAQSLPYEDETFDVLTISFGLRNVTDIDKALREMRRVLKRGGRFECLEFSKVEPAPLRALYDAYSKHVIPEIGHRVADDRASSRTARDWLKAAALAAGAAVLVALLRRK